MSKGILFDDVLSEKYIDKALENNAVAVPVNSAHFYHIIEMFKAEFLHYFGHCLSFRIINFKIQRWRDSLQDWFEQAEPAEFLSINEMTSGVVTLPMEITV